MKNLKNVLKTIFSIPEENEMSAKYRYAETEPKPTDETDRRKGERNGNERLEKERDRNGSRNILTMKKQSPIPIIFIGLLILSMVFISCSMLQNTPEYRNYPKNTSWKP